MNAQRWCYNFLETRFTCYVSLYSAYADRVSIIKLNEWKVQRGQ